MASGGLNIVAVMGSARPGRNVERVAKFIQRTVEARGHTVQLIDPLTVGFDLTHNPLHFHPDPSKAPEGMRKMNETVKQADAFIVLSGEYNRSVPPALTNLLDHLAPRSWAFKTSAIVSYSVGLGQGMVMIPQLRAHLVEFGAPPVPCCLSIGQVNQKLNEDGEPGAEHSDRLAQQVAKMMSQLEWYAGALKDKRTANGGDLDWEGGMVSM